MSTATNWVSRPASEETCSLFDARAAVVHARAIVNGAIVERVAFMTLPEVERMRFEEIVAIYRRLNLLDLSGALIAYRRALGNLETARTRRAQARRDRRGDP